MSFVPFANVPEGVPAGRITAYVTSFEADGSDPGMVPDDTPDSIPLDGTVTITPRVGTMKWPGLPKPQTSVMSALVCPVIDGDLYRPGTTLQNYQDVDPGVTVVATDQPDAQPSTVQYEVRWNLTGARVQPQTTPIDVPANGVVDLATVIPASPEPGTVQVTYTVDRERAEAAADLAEGFAGEAETARDQAVTAKDQAGVSAGEAAASALAVAAPGHTVTWDGAETLPVGEGFILATLTGDTTLSLPARGTAAESVNLLVEQDTTGGRKLTLEGAATAYGVAIQLTDDAHALDFITLVWTGSQWLTFMGAANLLIPAEWVV